MKKVMAFGTFDIFHPGHQSYLKQAKELSEYLIVIVAKDKTVKEFKQQKTKNREKERMRVVMNSKLANKVILGNLKNKYAVIEKFRPEVIALGYDQKVDMTELKNKLKEISLKSKIVRLKSYRPEVYKSSKLKHA
jgi:FAD synthetase